MMSTDPLPLRRRANETRFRAEVRALASHGAVVRLTAQAKSRVCTADDPVLAGAVR